MISIKKDEVKIELNLQDWQVRTIDDVIKEGWLSHQDGCYVLSNDNYYKIDPIYKDILELPNVYSGSLKLRLRNGGLRDKDSNMVVEFDDLSYRIERFFLFQNEKIVYELSESQYSIIELVNRFNSTAIRRAEGPILFARIRALINESQDSWQLDRYLNEQDACLVEKVKLKPRVNGDNVTLLPEIAESPHLDFGSAFEKAKRIPAYEYEIRRDARKTKVIIGDKDSPMQQSLRKLKSKNTYTPGEIKDLLLDPAKHFNEEVIDFESLFGDRVIGLSALAPKASLVMDKVETDWFPGIDVEGQRLLLQEKEDYYNLKSDYSEALSENQQTLEFKGTRITLENADAMLKVAQKVFEKSQPVSPETMDSELKKKYVVVHDNIEDLTYSEKFQRVNLEIKGVELKKILNLKKYFALKEHQKEGIAWLQTMYGRGAPGVLLADDMGLGKTLQILYYLESIAKDNQELTRVKKHLIVCPASLLENWEEEYSKFFDNPSYEIGLIRGKSNSLFSRLRSERSDIDNSWIYLTTYETLRIQVKQFLTIDWDVIILDEAQKIKEPATQVTFAAKGLKAKFKIAMTGTPVENSKRDLWSIMDFCYAGLLGSEKSFGKLVKENDNHDTAIRNKMGSLFMRRLKSDVAKDLPSKQEIKIEQEMAGEQLEMYLSVLVEIQNTVANNQSRGQAVLQALNQLRNISDSPITSLKSFKSDDFNFQDSAKLQVLYTVLSDVKSKEEKCIVFTQTRLTQVIVKEFLQSEFSINASIVNGDVPSSSSYKSSKETRQQMIDKFQEKNGFNVIIMSPIAAGFGLNVVGANHVFHYTRHWNPAKEQQATDRAYRIGQDKDVYVYLPITTLPNDAVSFDQNLDKLLTAKKTLSTDLIFPSEKIKVTDTEMLDAILH